MDSTYNEKLTESEKSFIKDVSSMVEFDEIKSKIQNSSREERLKDIYNKISNTKYPYDTFQYYLSEDPAFIVYEFIYWFIEEVLSLELNTKYFSFINKYKNLNLVCSLITIAYCNADLHDITRKDFNYMILFIHQIIENKGETNKIVPLDESIIKNSGMLAFVGGRFSTHNNDIEKIKDLISIFPHWDVFPKTVERTFKYSSYELITELLTNTIGYYESVNQSNEYVMQLLSYEDTIGFILNDKHKVEYIINYLRRNYNNEAYNLKISSKEDQKTINESSSKRNAKLVLLLMYELLSDRYSHNVKMKDLNSLLSTITGLSIETLNRYTSKLFYIEGNKQQLTIDDVEKNRKDLIEKYGTSVKPLLEKVLDITSLE